MSERPVPVCQKSDENVPTESGKDEELEAFGFEPTVSGFCVCHVVHPRAKRESAYDASTPPQKKIAGLSSRKTRAVGSPASAPFLEGGLTLPFLHCDPKGVYLTRRRSSQPERLWNLHPSGILLRTAVMRTAVKKEGGVTYTIHAPFPFTRRSSPLRLLPSGATAGGRAAAGRARTTEGRPTGWRTPAARWPR